MYLFTAAKSRHDIWNNTWGIRMKLSLSKICFSLSCRDHNSERPHLGRSFRGCLRPNIREILWNSIVILPSNFRNKLNVALRDWIILQTSKLVAFNSPQRRMENFSICGRRVRSHSYVRMQQCWWPSVLWRMILCNIKWLGKTVLIRWCLSRDFKKGKEQALRSGRRASQAKRLASGRLWGSRLLGLFEEYERACRLERRAWGGGSRRREPGDARADRLRPCRPLLGRGLYSEWALKPRKPVKQRRTWTVLRFK